MSKKTETKNDPWKPALVALVLTLTALVVGIGLVQALTQIQEATLVYAPKIVAIFIAFTVLVFALAVLLGGGIRLVWISFALGQTSGALQIPLGYVYLVVPVSGVCVVFYALGWLLEARSGQSAAATQSGALN